MQGVEIGPLVFFGPRFAAITGIIVFVIVTEVLARSQRAPFRRWSGQVVIGGILAARLGFVALHWRDYLADPVSVFYVWQGGFSLLAAGVSVVAISLWHLWKSPHYGSRMALSLAIAFAAANLVVFTNTGSDDIARPQGSLPGLGIDPLTFQIDPAGNTRSLDGLPRLSGGMLNISDRNGKPLVINLWASWCPPCRRELPMMAEVAAGLINVDMVFANQGESQQVVEAFLAREGLSLGAVVIDSGQSLFSHYSALGLPTTLFIGADGRLQASHVGEISRSQLNAEIERLKGGP